MATTLERLDALPDPGVAPVPPEHRLLSGFDVAVLWGDLGVGLLVLVTGGLLVPALGFGQAVAAIVLGSLIGVTLLAAGGAVGARHNLPTMALLRPFLGDRGSWVPSAINGVTLIGWTAVELWAMSVVADLVSERIFGFSARWLWLGIAAVVCTTLALWGPVGVTRLWLERFGAWVTGGICVVVTILVLASDGISSAVSAGGAGGFPTFGAALDLVIVMPVSWLPLVADYTRFASRPRSAALGTFWGYLIANVWLYALGALLVLSQGSTPDPAGIAGGILAVAGGSIAGLLFLGGLLAGETDEAFANIYSGSVSLQNIWPKLPRKALSVAIAVIGTVLAARLNMVTYETFLFLLGSVFLPLFGVIGARYLLDGTSFASTSRVRTGVASAFVAWVAGFAVYHWILPTGPSWWTEAIADLVGTPLFMKFSWLPASIPALATAFLLQAAWVVVARRRTSRHEAGAL
jgi:putative hydroxymethylpyrimidine transporter CytX